MVEPLKKKNAPTAVERDLTSPLSVLSATAVVETAYIGAIVMPHQIPGEQLGAEVTSATQDKQFVGNTQSASSDQSSNERSPQKFPQLTQVKRDTPVAVDVTTKPALRRFPSPQHQQSDIRLAPQDSREAQTPSVGLARSQPYFPRLPATERHGSPPAPQEISLNLNTSGPDRSQIPPYFPPPPVHHNSSLAPQKDIKLTILASGTAGSQTPPAEVLVPSDFAQKFAHSSNNHEIRAGSIVSTVDLKPQKKPRKVFNMLDWLPFKQRNQLKKRAKADCWGEERREKENEQASYVVLGVLLLCPHALSVSYYNSGCCRRLPQTQ